MPQTLDAAEIGLFARFAEMLGLSGGGTSAAPAGKPPGKMPPALRKTRLDRALDKAQDESSGRPGLPFSEAYAKLGSTYMEPVALRRRLAQRQPSFTDLLPYERYLPDEQVFVLKDGSTLGIMFELTAIPTEAQPLSFLASRAMRVQEALQALPETDGPPWIVQFFLNDDRDIAGLNAEFRDYIAQVHEKEPERQKTILESPMTRAFVDEMARHLAQVSKPEGLFMDTLVTGQIWRGQMRRARCCIYRRFDEPSAVQDSPALAQMEAVAMTLNSTLAEAGVQVRRCNGQDLHDWLVPFFNRNPKIPKGESLIGLMPYPGDRAGDGRPAGTNGPDDRGEAPIFGWSIAELLNHSEPRSDPKTGIFFFDDVPVRAMTLQNMRRQPEIGHLSAELSGDDKKNFARFDRLPPGAMLALSMTIKPQHLVQRHVEKIQHASRAQNALAREAHAECEAVLDRMMALNDKLFPLNFVLYLTGQNMEALEASISDMNALLGPTGLRFIDPKQDLTALDAFIRALPFNYAPHFDEKYMKRARLTFASQIAALLPVYGRSRGTGHPGMWFWNRGGEPLWLDPLNKRDRQKNAHMLVLGPTGAGKSATLNYLAMMAMAVHRPRLVIVDAGKSFRLLVEWFRTMGLSVHSVVLSSEAGVSLPPFVNACKILDDPDVMESFQAVESLTQDEAGMEAALEQAPILTEIDADEQQEEQASTPTDGEQGPQDNEAEKRDYLGEVLIAAMMMITGGEKKEEEKMSRSDRYLITRAIIGAAWQARAAGKAHPLVHDVAIALMQMQKDPALSPTRQARAEDMGQAMMSFAQGLRGKLFNRPGEDWPEVDVTLVEMGTLAYEGYEDARALAYTSLLDSTQARGERFQYEGRPLVFLTDEAHLITTSDLLGPRIAKATKMWRKFNTWLWLATQNLKDFPGSMDRVLSMCEYWMLLTMDKSEIEEAARFRSLTDEQRAMMESAKKEPPKYTEGVIMDASGQYLFRNVPPALPIALAMTEGHEKAARRRIMQQRNCTEMEAAQYMAEQLAANRG